MYQFVMNFVQSASLNDYYSLSVHNESNKNHSNVTNVYSDEYSEYNQSINNLDNQFKYTNFTLSSDDISWFYSFSIFLFFFYIYLYFFGV